MVPNASFFNLFHVWYSCKERIKGASNELRELAFKWSEKNEFLMKFESHEKVGWLEDLTENWKMPRSYYYCLLDSKNRKLNWNCRDNLMQFEQIFMTLPNLQRPEQGFHGRFGINASFSSSQKAEIKLNFSPRQRSIIVFSLFLTS